MHIYLFIIILSALRQVAISNELKFANMFGDYMVLQSKTSQIWGTSVINDKINVTLSLQINNKPNQTIQSVQAQSSNSDNSSQWIVQFLAMAPSYNGEQYTIIAKSLSTNQIISLSSIVFGDVFICSGESNMKFPVNQTFNSSDIISTAQNYPLIRLFTASYTTSNQCESQFISVESNWSIPNNQTLSKFSAVCWIFGKNMFEFSNYPIGLILSATNNSLLSTNNSIISWLSNDVLNQYNITQLYNQSSVYYNAMLCPLFKTTIRALIWYQGESDASNLNIDTALNYSSFFVSFINDIRLKWSTMSATNQYFPFGFVQISSWNDTNSNSCVDDNYLCLRAANVRYGQTANYGYIPNDMLSTNVFIATSIDLGDYSSPFGDIYSRYKEPIANRLSQAGQNVIYDEINEYWLGPIAYEAYENIYTDIVVNFKNVNKNGLVLHNEIGFELYDNATNKWIFMKSIQLTNSNFSVAILTAVNEDCFPAIKVRYSWYTAPCDPTQGIQKCAVYDRKTNVPAMPFILDII